MSLGMQRLVRIDAREKYLLHKLARYVALKHLMIAARSRLGWERSLLCLTTAFVFLILKAKFFVKCKIFRFILDFLNFGWMNVAKSAFLWHVFQSTNISRE